MDRHTLLQTINQVDELLRFGSPSCIRQANGIMIENFNAIAHFALRLTEPKPKPKHTIADNSPAGGLTATEPCMFCEDHEALEAANATLKEFATHKDNCPARRMFYLRECPYCGSRRNHWQSGGPGFEQYRVCEKCDGPAYIPEERPGECTCGLEQALKGK